MLLQLLWDILILPILENLEEVLEALGCEQSNIVDNRANGTSSVGTATEAKEENLIPWLPVVAEKTVAFTNMCRDGEAGCASNELVCNSTVGSDALMVVDNLGMVWLLGRGCENAGVQGAAQASDVRWKGDVLVRKDAWKHISDMAWRWWHISIAVLITVSYGAASILLHHLLSTCRRRQQ